MDKSERKRIISEAIEKKYNIDFRYPANTIAIGSDGMPLPRCRICLRQGGEDMAVDNAGYYHVACKTNQETGA